MQWYKCANVLLLWLHQVLHKINFIQLKTYFIIINIGDNSHSEVHQANNQINMWIWDLIRLATDQRFLQADRMGWNDWSEFSGDQSAFSNYAEVPQPSGETDALSARSQWLDNPGRESLEAYTEVGIETCAYPFVLTLCFCLQDNWLWRPTASVSSSHAFTKYTHIRIQILQFVGLKCIN